jgi:hypothetical protein
MMMMMMNVVITFDVNYNNENKIESEIDVFNEIKNE